MSLENPNNWLDLLEEIDSSRGRKPMPHWKLGYLIRCEGYHYSQSYDENGRTEVYFDHYEIIKLTPCGCWIDVWGKKKFVIEQARKKWAYPTKELALKSFQIRKQWQIRHLERQLISAQAQLKHSLRGML